MPQRLFLRTKTCEGRRLKLVSYGSAYKRKERASHQRIRGPQAFLTPAAREMSFKAFHAGRRTWVLSVSDKSIECNCGVLQTEEHRGNVALESQRKTVRAGAGIWRHMREGRWEGGLRELCGRLGGRVGLGQFAVRLYRYKTAPQEGSCVQSLTQPITMHHLSDHAHPRFLYFGHCLYSTILRRSFDIIFSAIPTQTPTTSCASLPQVSRL